MNRFWKFKQVDPSRWHDWRWQHRNRLTGASDIRGFFPRMSQRGWAAFKDYTRRFRFALTPYVLSLVDLDDRYNPVRGDPIWNQFRFLHRRELPGSNREGELQENWEVREELPTPILHHKYPDRAILRVSNMCLGHCNFCYLPLRVLDRVRTKGKGMTEPVWQSSLAYLRRHPAIRDVLLSGGDPLVLDNQRLERLLFDLSRIESVRSIRLNTRVFTFNPYRVDRDLVSLFAKYRLTALEIHLVHPREMTGTFDDRLGLFEDLGYRPLILWRAPLLRGINDDLETLEELLTGLYRRRIVPYYLFHYAPSTLGRSVFGTSVQRGAELLGALRRRIPGPSFPRYVLFHLEGKQDIPLDPAGSASFSYTRDERDRPMVRFLNWRNHWVSYPDVEEGDALA